MPLASPEGWQLVGEGRDGKRIFHKLPKTSICIRMLVGEFQFALHSTAYVFSLPSGQTEARVGQSVRSSAAARNSKM